MNDRQVNKNEKKARAIGIVSTILVHVAILFIFVNAGLKYNYPPPQEMGILIEFEEVEIKPLEVKAGNEPKAEVVKPKEEIKLVQKSEAQEVGTKQNEAPEATVGTEGDVEVPEPPRPKPIDKRALFSAADNKGDSLAAQTADKVSDALKAGHSQGNTSSGDTEGAPSVQLKGRTIGTLPFPEYNVNKAGKVVVEIRVDQYGKVINATAGVAGTTVQDKELWEAAKNAAIKARFNVSSTAATVQVGTITYIFNLR